MALPLQSMSIDARECTPKMEVAVRLTRVREMQVRIRMATTLLALLAKLLPNCEVTVVTRRIDSWG